jgi:membrane protease YdiL (CAAX protease family)
MPNRQVLRLFKDHLIVFFAIAIVWGVHAIPPLNLIGPYTREHFGLRWNWMWPFDAIWMGLFAAKILRVRILRFPSKPTKVYFQGFLGLSLGSIGYLLFRLGAGTAGTLGFKGFSLETFLFELFVPHAEEVFYRGVLQFYLSQSWRSKVASEFSGSIYAGLFISLLFGLIHALNPVMRGKSFDHMAFSETFLFSLLATYLFARFKNTLAPSAAHYAWNYIDHFF